MPTPQGLTFDDLLHLRRAVELAAEALEAGEEPFGCLIVSRFGGVSHGERNRASAVGDSSYHPEFELVTWAVHNLSPEERRQSTVYSTGEHCPTCAVMHVLCGLGPIVYGASSAQLAEWQAQFRRMRGEADAEMPAEPRPRIFDIAPGINTYGPVPQLEGEILALHRRFAGV